MIRAALVIALVCVWGCRPLPPPTFPEYHELHHRAEYTGTGSAVSFVGRLRTNEGRVAFYNELDGDLRLLRELRQAQARLLAYPLAPGAPPSHHEAVAAELSRVEAGIRGVARLVRELLDMAAAGGLVETIPEMDEALRLARGKPPIPGLDPATLRERQRLIKGGPARCGAEAPDPIAGPHPPPAFWIMARDEVDESGREVQYPPEVKARFARILGASRAQRQALGLYGPFQAITAGPGGRGETWRFEMGTVARGPYGARSANYGPRAVIVECDFDARGQLIGGRERVIDDQGRPVQP